MFCEAARFRAMVVDPMPKQQALLLLGRLDAHNLELSEQATACELVAASLREVLQQLSASKAIEVGQVVAPLLEADVPSRLVDCLGDLGFEVQKIAVRVVAAIFKVGLHSGTADK